MTTINKNFFIAPSASRLGGAAKRTARAFARAATLLQQRGQRAAMLVLLMLTTAMAWADNVNLSVDDAIAEGTAGHRYMNMPTTGTNTLTLSDASVTTFKVYDDGGKSGNYSDNCNGTLTLTAPTGYVLQLSGNITTEKNYDLLTVYDNSEASGTKLLDAVSSTGNGTQTAITSVTSSGQSMTLYFSSDGSRNYDGLDLTVTLVNPNAEFGITVGSATGGSIAATVGSTSATTAKVNDVVTLTASPESGYVLSGISVVDGNVNAVAVDWNVWTNTATFTMPGSAVTVTPTFTNDLTSLSINMPATGTKTATIPSGVQSFKVYDDGGASGYYTNGCSGTLTLTAPMGYVLQLSGNITTEKFFDELTVYDGSTTSATKLLDAVSSTSSGTKTAITTVTSSGQSLTLYFYSNRSNNYAGLDLTVTLVSTSTEYGITINNATGGSVATTVGGQAASTAKVNDVVTLTATPESGYVLSSLSVVDGSGNAVAVDWNVWTNTATFTMPGSAVTVTPTFTNDLTVAGGLYINMPATGTKTATIPAGVQSFKVYDDGGASGNYSGNYSDNCSGTLTLTAPTGYVLQLSGNITTENFFDKLTVYDGSTTSATKLLDAVSSIGNGTKTAITSVTSSGQSMTLYFYSNVSNNYAGLDLTVTVAIPDVQYNINGLGAATGGSIAATVGSTSATTTKVNDVVTLTASPESGYVLSGISVVDGNVNTVAVDWNVWTNTATFTMPGSAVTVTPTFTNDLTSLSINMPVTGTQSATIPAGVQSFKVYDDGGASGYYTNGCSGILTLTAPTGYVLQLSGNITTEKNIDKLTVYDGSTTSATKLLDAVSSTGSGTQTAITSVTSSGQSMTLYFYSDGVTNYAGLDLTVTLVSTSTEYGITISNATGGSVATTVGGQAASTAKVNDVVTLTATPESGYMLSSLSVVDGSGNAVAVTGGWYTNNQATFSMPGSAVTVTPTFTNDLTSLSINMPATGTQSATIPANVQSFKVYDDGGAGGNYSDNCSGTLTLTAPTGYVMQLSGNITTEKNYDLLTVYDGSTTSATKLLDAVSSTGNGTQTAITSVTSSGQSLTLYFSSDGSRNYDGLDLTVTVIKLMELVDNADNSAVIDGWNGGVANVTLSGRTLYKDGKWNTLCLPFDVDLTATDCPLYGATARSLTAASVSGTTLNLTFGDAVNTLEAGTPYIIKWDGDGTSNIENPVFEGVTIDATKHDYDTNAESVTTDERVRFVGTYKSTAFDAENKSILLMGEENTLYYPAAGAGIGAQRAYFKIGDDDNALLARRLTVFSIDFGEDEEEATGIISVSAETRNNADGWYSLDGRKLVGKPTQHGIYINNGKKVVIK